MQMINEIKERSDETNQKSKQKISKLNARIKELLREKEELNTVFFYKLIYLNKTFKEATWINFQSDAQLSQI